jgi:hypothetical protein
LVAGAHVTDNVIVALAVLGVIGQVLVGILLLFGLLWLVGVRAPLRATRTAIWGYELWLAFLVSAIATAGSLFFSEVADSTRIRARDTTLTSRSSPTDIGAAEGPGRLCRRKLLERRSRSIRAPLGARSRRPAVDR